MNDHYFGNHSKHNSNLSLTELQFVLNENAMLNDKTIQIMFPVRDLRTRVVTRPASQYLTLGLSSSRIPVSATRYHWTLYVDPITSLILTLLILMTTLKVLKVPIMILLQTVPKNINLKQLRKVYKMMYFSCLLIG